MRFNFSLQDGKLHVSQVHGFTDLTSLRLALQVGVAGAAPFVLALATEALAGQPGAGLVIGGAFGTMLVIRTTAEAAQMDDEHKLKLEHARELSRIEIEERKARLPARRRASAPRGATLQPVADPAEEERVLLAADVRYVFEQGVRRGSFARADFIQPGRPRLQLPSGDELTRPKFEQVIAALMADGLLVKGLNGSPCLPGQAGGQAGRQSDMPVVIADRKRAGASTIQSIGAQS